MENRRDLDDQLEELLRKESEDHQMYPSDMVWENIRTEIHGTKSWPGLTIFSVAIIVSLSVITFLNYPPQNLIDKKVILPNQEISMTNNAVSEEAITNAAKAYSAQIDPATITAQTIESISTQQLEENSFIAKAEPETIQLPTLTVNSKTEITAAKPSVVYNVNNESKDYAMQLSSDNNNVAETNAAKETTKTTASKFAGIQFNGTDKDEDPNAVSLGKDAEVLKHTTASKWSWQLYATPSVSYRKLEDATPTIISLTNGNVDKSVQHKPAMGFELGLGFKYSITKNLRLTTGLQFNIRQYYIGAYQSFGIATFSFVNNNRLDSISLFSTLANVNSNNSYLSTKIDNKLYQISIPIGLEFDVVNGKKFGARMAASIQPTFTLNKSIYAISSDYKYYADGTPFFRKWNYNSNFEINLTYKTGNNTIWYIGPQIRYQHLPTYNDVYSIKEHRIDYGLKIGFTKPLN